MTEDPRFFGWLDGELDEQEAAAMAERVAADPGLRDLARQHRALHGRLRAAFDPIALAPVPERLAAVAEPKTATVLDLSAERGRRRPAPWLQLTAMAASLAIGLVTGATLMGGEQGPLRRDSAGLMAAGDLRRALDVRLASAPVAGSVRIGLTFRNREGALCRTFTDQGTAGLACRTGNEWRMHGLFAAPDAENRDYRMAAGQDPRLLDLVDEMIVGEPLDAEAEAALVRNGWQR